MSNINLDVLYSIKVGQILANDKTGEIYSVHSDYPVKDAFELMIRKKVLSLPIFDSVHRKYNNFIDMVDIVCFCMKHFSKKELIDFDMNYILESKQIFEKFKCGDICDLSGRNAYLPVESTAPLKVAIDLMSKWGVHRIPIIDAEGTLISILTQSKIIEYLYKNLEKIGDLSVLLQDIPNMGNPNVITIQKDALVMDAFKLIQENNISAIGVVNQIGILEGNISVSDMKMVGYDGKLLSRMFLPVETFMDMIPKNPTIQMFNNILCVRDTTTLEETITKFYLSKVHRIYKIDHEGRPKSVISQGDVLKYFSKE
ncbi:hypothetical protein CYY_008512 [Polysphondylium violaceum]|uniref:CBS domain-containing protein n=1 Tax=Polysphondylium violaceum TaxID=133409 RepID=A0A8J4UWW2_9MYCE|nr:hypothetical protein CYY_008512 [Polysphondylium violaceum]